MWFTQYGQLWGGPWFLLGDAVTAIYVAGIMHLANAPSTTLVMADDQ